MYIYRTIKNQIIKKIKATDKIAIIYGPRQVGKTTLSKKIIKELKLKTLSINADEEKYSDILSSRDFTRINGLISGYDLIFIDEAQRISNIGINLKIIKEQLPSLKIIATGSSSFDLANKISEPLTGRVWTYNLYSLSILELEKYFNKFEIDEKLEELLVFGAYPEVFTTQNWQAKQELLMEISKAYLYKDILQIGGIKYADKIKKLLQLLAFQIGSEVSISELARQLEINKETVNNYIDLLEKTFIVFRLSGFNRNLRKEVSKMDKIYFYDLGIRNIVIDNLKSLDNRNDVGQLWENFLLVERKKYLTYTNKLASQYFWRVSTGAELDYVEEREGKLYGFEFKYGHKQVRAPKTWLEEYKNSKFKLINRENYLEFVGGDSNSKQNQISCERGN